MKFKGTVPNGTGTTVGAELRAYGTKRAEAIIAAGLDIFELNEESLGEMKKGADEKLLIASIVREETTVKARWLAERSRSACQEAES